MSYAYNHITDYQLQQRTLEFAIGKVIESLGDFDDLCVKGSPWNVRAQEMIIELGKMQEPLAKEIARF